VEGFNPLEGLRLGAIADQNKQTTIHAQGSHQSGKHGRKKGSGRRCSRIPRSVRTPAKGVMNPGYNLASTKLIPAASVITTSLSFSSWDFFISGAKYRTEQVPDHDDGQNVQIGIGG
jgi:hypothetical protein